MLIRGHVPEALCPISPAVVFLSRVLGSPPLQAPGTLWYSAVSSRTEGGLHPPLQALATVLPDPTALIQESNPGVGRPVSSMTHSMFEA